jgi:uncharacterized membrane protein
MASGERSALNPWIMPCLLMLLAVVPGAAGVARMLELSSGASVTLHNSRFFAAPIPVVMHILSVVPFSFLGALQLSPAFRQRSMARHRVMGKILVPLGLVAALTGLWMTTTYPWPKGDGLGLHLLRLLAGSAMVTELLLALLSLARKDYPGHGAWMIRAYAVAMGAGTQVVTHIPYFALFGDPGERARTLLMGAGWLINVVVAECVIHAWPARRLRNRSHTFRADAI